MRITIEKLKELGACEGGIEMFPRFPGLDAKGEADVRELCLWACMEGCENYSCWLLPRLMEPTGAAEWAIRCAKLVCRDESWILWAEKWLSGEDRSKDAADAAAADAEDAGWSAADAAAAAARAAAWAAAGAARAAELAAELAALWSAEEAGADPIRMVDIAMEIIERGV